MGRKRPLLSKLGPNLLVATAWEVHNLAMLSVAYEMDIHAAYGYKCIYKVCCGKNNFSVG